MNKTAKSFSSVFHGENIF